MLILVCLYLKVPNGHCSIDARGAELATIPFVSLIDRHLAKEQTCRNSFKRGEEVLKLKIIKIHFAILPCHDSGCKDGVQNLRMSRHLRVEKK